MILWGRSVYIDAVAAEIKVIKPTRNDVGGLERAVTLFEESGGLDWRTLGLSLQITHQGY